MGLNEHIHGQQERQQFWAFAVWERVAAGGSGQVQEMMQLYVIAMTYRVDSNQWRADHVHRSASLPLGVKSRAHSAAGSRHNT